MFDYHDYQDVITGRADLKEPLCPCMNSRRRPRAPALQRNHRPIGSYVSPAKQSVRSYVDFLWYTLHLVWTGVCPLQRHTRAVLAVRAQSELLFSPLSSRARNTGRSGRRMDTSLIGWTLDPPLRNLDKDGSTRTTLHLFYYHNAPAIVFTMAFHQGSS